MIPARLSLVTLGARDVPGLRAFYERLGWETKSTADDFAAFPLGGAILALYDLSALAEEAGGRDPTNAAAQADPGAFKGFTVAINVDREEQVAEAIAAARDAGATILAEPVKRDWGGVSAYFADPEGNVWEVAWIPGAAFDDRGALIWPF
jgi:catechol 2,3-dioxygenase-like lactoylglutathione lyase family enzyme